jgi:hypothetical protein
LVKLPELWEIGGGRQVIRHVREVSDDEDVVED